MNKLWLLTFTKDNIVEIKQIEVIEEHKIKFRLEKESPFSCYEYIHKHNLNIVQPYGRKLRYIVSETKEGLLKSFDEYYDKKIKAHICIIERLHQLKEEVNKII